MPKGFPRYCSKHCPKAEDTNASDELKCPEQAGLIPGSSFNNQRRLRNPMVTEPSLHQRKRRLKYSCDCEKRPLVLDCLLSSRFSALLESLNHLTLSLMGSPVRGDTLVIIAVASSKKEFGVAPECILYFFPDTSRA